MTLIVAGTGHRPEDCEHEKVVRRKIRDSLIEIGPDVAICGMAAGFDLWYGDEARLLGIDLWAARPWATHGPRKGDEDLYAGIVGAASRIVNVVDTDKYPGPWVYHKRNEWMVNHCHRLVSYWNGKQVGGTFQCRLYAKTRGIEIDNVFQR